MKWLGVKDDFMEIKSYVFFLLINWDDFINKKIIFFFNLNVSGFNDLWYFDFEFIEEFVFNFIGKFFDSIFVIVSVKEVVEVFLGFFYVFFMDFFF